MIRTVLAGVLVALITMSLLGVADVSIGDATVDLPSVSMNGEDD